MPDSIGGGAAPPQLLRDYFGFRACLVQRYAWSETRHGPDADHSGSGVPVFFIRLQNQRSEDVNVFVVRSQGLRQYADDGDAASVQNNLSACNARVRAKTTTPASVGENHDCVAALGLLLVAEVPAEAPLNP